MGIYLQYLIGILVTCVGLMDKRRGWRRLLSLDLFFK